mgnify:CR=1 FL=1
MNGTNLFKIALRALANNKLRAFLTMLGIIIGVASVITMLAIGQGSKKSIQAQISEMGSNMIMIHPGSDTRGGVRQDASSMQTLKLTDYEALRDETNFLTAVSPNVSSSGQLIAGNNNYPASVNGVSTEYLEIRQLSVESGEMFTEADIQNAAKVCIIGKTISVEQLEEEGFKGVFVASGAGLPNFMNIPGENSINILSSNEYLTRVNLMDAASEDSDTPVPFGKNVAVIGGGNSGIEAAIDLAGICRKVTVFEFADTLKADQVLQEKAQSLPNVEIFTSSQTTKVVGNGDKVTAIRVKDRVSSEERDFPLDGIFVQIGLAANSAPFRDMLETTPIGEIKIDAFCRTTLPGVYAAGDVSDVPYKQIVIAMGEGAKAALSAFDDRIRGIA